MVTDDTISLTDALPGPVIDGINCPRHVFVDSAFKVGCTGYPRYTDLARRPAEQTERSTAATGGAPETAFHLPLEPEDGIRTRDPHLWQGVAIRPWGPVRSMGCYSVHEFPSSPSEDEPVVERPTTER